MKMIIEFFKVINKEWDWEDLEFVKEVVQDKDKLDSILLLKIEKQ